MDKTEFNNSVPLKDIRIHDSFWDPFMERIRTKVIPYQWEALNDRIEGAEPSRCVRNFKLAAELTRPELNYNVPKDTGCGGFVFQDSDLAKWIEAASYSLAWHQDEELEKTLDGVIDIICNAQQSDGYLDTYYIITGLEKRFTNLRDNHELYCFGHLTEAAVAYYSITGKRKLLDAVIRFADCIDKNIGPEEGKLHGYPGHETAEMALVRLYGITKDERYLKLAKYFIDQRGQKPLYFEEEAKRNGNDFYWKNSYVQYQYYQAGKPVREQRVAEGHAVRAVYLYSGMADIARLTGDGELLKICGNLFDDIVKRQMYITGGIGQSAYGEAFSYDYDLPNDTVYAETCASIGLAFFAQRMISIKPKGVYGDVLEKVLYNGIISGMALDGRSFFYVNPLEAVPEASLKSRNHRHVKIQRQKWFACACCPPNLARILASLGSYIHSVRNDAIYTHLFIGSDAKLRIGTGEVNVKIETRYPWDGRVGISFDMDAPAVFNYGLRIPGWCSKYSISLEGGDIADSCKRKDGYALITREWKAGDKLTVQFDMPVCFVRANPRVREDAGKIAIMRGPVVYCLEEADNGPELHRLRAGEPPDTEPSDIQVKYEKDLLEGVVSISLRGKRQKDWPDGSLYNAYDPAF
jgi:DUF1680 family protein